jgi:DNA-binding protein H-NS
MRRPDQLPTRHLLPLLYQNSDSISQYIVLVREQQFGNLNMAKDLERMSFRELQELELKVKKAKASVQDRSRNELRKKLEAMASSQGFKIGDLFGARGGKGRTVAAKYANPDNPSETWTGRGRKPLWLAAKLKSGDRIEKFLIK